MKTTKEVKETLKEHSKRKFKAFNIVDMAFYVLFARKFFKDTSK